MLHQVSKIVKKHETKLNKTIENEKKSYNSSESIENKPKEPRDTSLIESRRDRSTSRLVYPKNEIKLYIFPLI